MPRVVPSQVISFINQSFPGTQNTPDFPIYSASAGILWLLCAWQTRFRPSY